MGTNGRLGAPTRVLGQARRAGRSGTISGVINQQFPPRPDDHRPPLPGWPEPPVWGYTAAALVLLALLAVVVIGALAVIF